MLLTKIQRDKHGLYVRRKNGFVYRPIVSKFTAGMPAAFDRNTIFHEGDEVKLFAERTGSLCTLWSLTAPYSERWSFHGATNDAEGIWNPAKQAVLTG